MRDAYCIYTQIRKNQRTIESQRRHPLLHVRVLRFYSLSIFAHLQYTSHVHIWRQTVEADGQLKPPSRHPAICCCVVVAAAYANRGGRPVFQTEGLR